MLRSRALRGGRLALLVLASLLVLPLAFGALSLLGSPSGGVQLAVIFGLVLACFGLLVMVGRRWALYEVRFEVTSGGVHEERVGAGGETRAREVPWSEIRDYVLSEYPNGARALTIRPRAGRGIAVAQGPREEDRAAFQAFHDAFLAGVKAYRPAEGAEAIRAAPSFFDGPVAKALAGGAVLLVAGLAVLVLLSGRPVGVADWLRLAMIGGLVLPFAVRVFAGPSRKPAGDGAERG